MNIKTRISCTFCMFLGVILSLVTVVTLEVNIAVVGDADSLVCNKKAIVICQIRPYRSTMTWEVDGTAVADCTFAVCTTYVSAGYAFAFDTKNGVFNITVDPVTYSNNRMMFKCDDGYTSASTTLFVKVLPKSSDLKMVYSTNQAGTSIMVTTGCVHPKASVTFKWQSFKDGNSPIPYTDKGFVSTNEEDCTTGVCGGPGVVKVTSTIIIQEDPNGESYYFQALVQHPDTEDMIVTSGRTFKLKSKSIDDIQYGPSDKGGLSAGSIVGIVVGCVVLIFVILLIV